MKTFAVLVLYASGSSAIVAEPHLVHPRQADSSISTVDLAATRGKPEHIASSSIYGIPDNFPNQIPSHWYTDMGWRWGKGGGGQLQAGGWYSGLKAYQTRFESTLANYQTCRAVGADYHIYVHDLWGTDHASQTSAWPGDGGDWKTYDQFVKQLMTDVATQMDPEHVTWDIWNEPDVNIFWKRDIQQWVDMYIRTHKLIRANRALDAMKISGPSLAFRPVQSNTYWTTWLAQIATNKTYPDYYTYHLEGGLRELDNDPQYTNVSLAALLRKYGVPERQTFINEYSSAQEQVPGGYIWWISRLERYDFYGMLGNWLGGTQLHDLFGGLLTKTRNRGDYKATDYVAAPGYPVYKYYNQNMTGQRATTTGSADRWFDTYATVGTDKVRILAGVKVNSGTWNVRVQGLSKVGYKSGTVSVTKLSFEGSSIQQIAGGIVNRGTENYTIMGDSITVPVVQVTSSSGWALEFPVRTGAIVY